jgi:hypothetical protein
MGALRRNRNAGHERRRWMERAVFGRGAPESVLRGGGVPAILDINFAADKAYVRGVETPISGLFSSIADAGASLYYTNADGSMTLKAYTDIPYGTNGLQTFPPRTNILRQSETFTAWGVSSVSVTSVTDVQGPTGNTEGKITESTDNNIHYMSGGAAVDWTAVNGTVYTMSAVVRKGTRDWCWIGGYDGAADYEARFNLTQGVPGTKTANVTSSGMKQLINDWFMVHMTWTAGANATFNTRVALSTGDNSSAYVGVATQYMYVQSVQVEAAPDPSPHIPTTTVALTGPRYRMRYTDATILSLTEGTGYSLFRRDGATISGVENALAGIHTGLDCKFALNIVGHAFVSDGTSTVTTGNAFTAAATQRAAFAWSSVPATASIVLNNDTVATGVYGTSPQTFNVLAIGCPGDNNDFHLGGYTQRFAYWNTRLPDAALGAIGQPASWVEVRDNYVADVDIDFTMNRACDRGLISTATDFLHTPFNRGAAVSYAQDTAGRLIPFGPTTPRITNLGLLCERGATNYMLNSNSVVIGDGVWQAYNGSTAVANVGTAPDGTETAALFTGIPGTGTFQNILGLTQSTHYTYSIFLKPISGSTLLYQWNGAGQTDITSGTPYGNGWYRLTGQYTTGVGEVTSQPPFVILHPDFGPGTFLMWGSQFELGTTSLPTSLIPTTSVAVTRAYDGNWKQLYWQNASYVDKFTTGTWFAHAKPIRSGVDARLLGGGLGINGNTAPFQYNGTTNLFATLGSGTGDVEGAKIAVSFRNGSRHLCGNAGTVATDTEFFGNGNGYTAFGTTVNFTEGADIDGYMKRATFWRNAFLADATLQSLTTL